MNQVRKKIFTLTIRSFLCISKISLLIWIAWFSARTYRFSRSIWNAILSKFSFNLLRRSRQLLQFTVWLKHCPYGEQLRRIMCAWIFLRDDKRPLVRPDCHFLPICKLPCRGIWRRHFNQSLQRRRIPRSSTACIQRRLIWSGMGHSRLRHCWNRWVARLSNQRITRW